MSSNMAATLWTNRLKLVLYIITMQRRQPKPLFNESKTKLCLNTSPLENNTRSINLPLLTNTDLEMGVKRLQLVQRPVDQDLGQRTALSAVPKTITELFYVSIPQIYSLLHISITSIGYLPGCYCIQRNEEAVERPPVSLRPFRPHLNLP